MSDTGLVVDFTDLNDIRAKLPVVRKLLEEQKLELVRLKKQAGAWQNLVWLLEELGGPDESETPEATEQVEPVPDSPLETAPEESQPVAAAQPLDLVVEVVNRDLRPIRAREVREILISEGHDIAPESTSNAMNYAATRAKPVRIKKTPSAGRGYYAPLEYQEPLDVAALRAEAFRNSGRAAGSQASVEASVHHGSSVVHVGEVPTVNLADTGYPIPERQVPS